MEDRTLNKEAILIGLFTVLVIAFIFGIIGCTKKVKTDTLKEKIKEYSTLVVNGEEYPIEDVVDVKYIISFYMGEAYEVTLEDGTKIRFMDDNYTLKK